MLGIIEALRDDKIKNVEIESDSKLILNRKNIHIFLSSARAVDYDIWRKSRNLNISFGTETLNPQTGFTFAEFTNNVLSQTITDSNVMKYKNTYISLEDIYSDYMNNTNNTGYTPYNFISLNEFITQMSPYWTQVIEQFVPATTLWNGGNLIENNTFNRSKYRHRKPCQIFELIDDVYPEPTGTTTQYFQDEIQTMWNMYNFASDLDSFNGVNNLQMEDGYIQFYPIFEIDGNIFSGDTDPSISNSAYKHYNGDDDPENYLALNAVTKCTYALLSGATTLTTTVTGTTYYKSVQLYKDTDDSVLTGKTLNVDYDSLKLMWKQAIINTVDYINAYSGTTIGDSIYSGGTLPYAPFTASTGSNVSALTTKPILSYEFFTDSEGVEKVRFKSYKYGPHDCTVMKSFNFLMGYGKSTPDPTPTPTPTMTMTPTLTPTNTVTPTMTPTMTLTPTNTVTPSSSMMATPSPTPTFTPTMTVTPTIPPPQIQLGAPYCRVEGNCNDNALCTVRYHISTSNAPVGSYITRTTNFPSSTASVSIYNNVPGSGVIEYTEPSGSANPVYFTLELRDSGGTIIATSDASITHTSFWQYLDPCPVDPSPTPTQTPTMTMTPSTSSDFYWWTLIRCDDGATTCYSTPKSNAQMAVGRIFYSAGGHYYTIGAPIRTDQDPDPGNGSCGDKVDGTMMAAGTTCFDTSETPIPSATYRTARLTAAWAYTGSTTYNQQLTDTCGLFPYQLTSLGYTGLSQNGSTSFYVDEASIVSGTTYTLYDSNVSGGGSVVNGGNKYYSILIYGSGSTFNYVVYINSSGTMSEWHACP